MQHYDVIVSVRPHTNEPGENLSTGFRLVGSNCLRPDRC